MARLHKDSIWEEHLRSSGKFDFFCTQKVYFSVVLCHPCVCNYVHKVIVGWLPSTVITVNSVLV